MLYPVTTYLRNESEIKSFLKEENLRAFLASRPVLKALLKEFYQREIILEGNAEQI